MAACAVNKCNHDEPFNVKSTPSPVSFRFYFCVVFCVKFRSLMISLSRCCCICSSRAARQHERALTCRGASPTATRRWRCCSSMCVLVRRRAPATAHRRPLGGGHHSPRGRLMSPPQSPLRDRSRRTIAGVRAVRSSAAAIRGGNLWFRFWSSGFGV